MRKFIISLAFMAFAGSLQAQNLYDAYNFSETTYGGTARSIALGNAMTAVGGDMGSLVFNPAGSAVNSYSQFSITPNLSISSARSKGGLGFGDETQATHARLNLYNVGFNLHMNNHRSRGLKYLSFGFVAHSTANYLNDIYASGPNGATSFVAASAAAADGYSSAELNSSNSWYNSSIPWNQLLAYQSGMIATYGGSDNQYLGATEKVYQNGDIGLAGDLDQEFGRFTRGNKTDILFNLGANISDWIYLGANLGLTSQTYRMDEYIKERAINPSLFAIDFDNGSSTSFTEARQRYNYRMDASGVYFKIGAILTPVSGLRIGAAIQTPTSVSISEDYVMDAYSRYTDSGMNASVTSPRDNEWTYRLVSPFKYNLGIAYTLGKWGLVSADYERTDYSQMKFKVSGDFSNRSYFDEANADIRRFYGVSNALRLGVEVRPIEGIALRAGYNYTSNPEKYKDASGKIQYSDTAKQAFSLGVGYASAGSFFADMAFRFTRLSDQYIYPYADYASTLSPEIHAKRNLSDIVLTFGWRF